MSPPSARARRCAGASGFNPRAVMTSDCDVKFAVPGRSASGPACQSRDSPRKFAPKAACVTAAFMSTKRAPISAPASACGSLPACPRSKPLSRHAPVSSRTAVSNCATSQPPAADCTANRLAPAKTSSAAFDESAPKESRTSTLRHERRPDPAGASAVSSRPMVARAGARPAQSVASGRRASGPRVAAPTSRVAGG